MMQIARDNVSALIAGKFSFSPENLLNKTIIFDVSRVDEKNIMDKICPLLMITFILSKNQVQNHFLGGVKMEKKPETLQEAKNIFEKLKTDLKSILFSEEENRHY